MLRIRRYYLVKWTGYSEAENTWLPAENLEHAKALVEDFYRRNPARSAEGRRTRGGNGKFRGTGKAGKRARRI